MICPYDPGGFLDFFFFCKRHIFDYVFPWVTITNLSLNPGKRIIQKGNGSAEQDLWIEFFEEHSEKHGAPLLRKADIEEKALYKINHTRLKEWQTQFCRLDTAK